MSTRPAVADLYTQERQGDWTIRVANTCRDWAPRAEDLLARAAAPDQVLREDGRSAVYRIEQLPGAPPGPWVLKSPRWKDRRTINRLTTLYRAGEACQAFVGALRLQSLGVTVPEPVMQMERRRGGMVVESWWLYRFAAGGPCREEDWPQVISLLGRLHAAGLKHRDPHLANWIQQDGQVTALDCNPRRALVPPLAAAYDFILLRNSTPALEPLLPLRGTLWWRLATFWDDWVHGFRALKKRLRGGGRQALPDA